MKTETWQDRDGWAAGPWDDEPDRAEWELSGFPCLALRHPSSGHWCGYVGVPVGHPWYGKSASWSDGDDIDADVHGGLTYAAVCTEDDRPAYEQVCHVTAGEDRRWWIGFDCHHYMDIAPGFEMRQRELGMRLRAEGDIAGANLFEHPDFGATYKTLTYVQGEVGGLVRQAHLAESVRIHPSNRP